MNRPTMPAAADAARMRRDLRAEDYQALAAFRAALRRFLAFSETGAAAHGVTAQQHQALLAIRACPDPDGLSVGELAEILLVRTHSAGELAGRLVQRRLAVRAASSEDRRRVLLTLTREGERVLEAISRSTLGKLKSNLPVWSEMMRALEDLDVPPPAET
jgi:DNA-binding MarR family transcriptional regulator